MSSSAILLKEIQHDVPLNFAVVLLESYFELVKCVPKGSADQRRLETQQKKSMLWKNLARSAMNARTICNERRVPHGLTSLPRRPVLSRNLQAVDCRLPYLVSVARFLLGCNIAARAHAILELHRFRDLLDELRKTPTAHGKVLRGLADDLRPQGLRSIISNSKPAELPT